MDAKQAIEYLRGKEYKRDCIDTEIANFIEQQEYLVKLGAATEKVVSECKDCSTSGICSNDVFDDNCIKQIECEWQDFCRLRREGVNNEN